MLARPPLAAALLLLALQDAGSAQIWTPTSAPGFGNPANDQVAALEYGGFLYAVAENPSGIEVWRHDGVGPWAPSITAGLGDANNTEAQGAALFGGDLYLMAGNTVTGVEVWRHDGATWTQVNADGFGSAANGDGDLTVLNGTLYAVTFDFTGGAGVWRFNGGTSWTGIGTGGLGDPSNAEAVLEFWNGDLYAGTSNFATGGEVRRYVSGTTWARVDPGSPGPGGGGFDASGAANEYVSPYVYNGTLYASTENYSTGTETWRYNGGTSWTQVNVDAFGTGSNVDIEVAEPFGGALYVGTISPLTGAEVQRFDGGSSWTLVSPGGFGDVDNVGIVSLAVHAGSLYAGTVNSVSGAQVWRYESGTTWTRLDPGGGFGDPSAEYALLVHFGGVLHAVVQRVVYRLEPPELYCTGKTNSAGCVPFMTVTGAPGVASAAAFDLVAHDVVPAEAGFVLYGFKKGNLSFHGGKLCVKLPFVRTPVKKATNPGGGCSGWILRRNFNATIQSGSDPSLTAGQTVFAQWRQRDPADPTGFGDSLSDAVRFLIGP